MATGLYNSANAYLTSPIPDFYPGQQVAGINPTQEQGYNDLLSSARQAQQAGSGLNNAMSGWLSAGPQWNPYLDRVINSYSNEMGRQFNENIIPGLRGQAIQANAAGGSASALAQSQAANDLQRTIGDQVGQLLANGFFGTQDRYLQTLNMAPGVMQGAAGLMGQPGAVQSTWGNLLQGQAQNNINAEMNRWNYYRDAPVNRLSAYSSFLQPGSGLYNQTTNSSGGGGSTLGQLGNAAMGFGTLANSPLGAWAGNALGTAGTAVASLLPVSDRRLKEDIQEIGKYPNGLPMYRFKYRGEPGEYIGVMSDDVRKVMPEAVVVFPDGYDRVDYGMLGVRMKRVH